MCGFLAEITFSDGSKTDQSIFESLLTLSKHRGPDDTSFDVQDDFQLGFNRLSIIDLSVNGNQPKISPSGRYHLVCNGEIYNYQTLARDYSLNALTSRSDTEVLVQLCDAIGIEKTISIINGMFAITIVDTKTKTSYLTRDFAGIKPLFYGLDSNGIIAASQFDQIYKHPWFYSNLKIRPEIVKEYFGFGYMQAPNTIYENIFQVNPGELIEVDSKGNLKKKTIVAFDRFQKKNKVNTKNKSLNEILLNSVNRQLVSDVSLSTFLSGGIDSPLISAYAKKGMPEIEAFTLKVNHTKLNESEIATSYAKHLGLRQKIIDVNEKDLIESVNAHFLAFSEPFGDYSSIPTYVITKEAKKQHSVMLSGDGGDELFFGYPRMLDVVNKRYWFKLPYFIRKPLAKLTNTFGLTKTWAPYYKSLDEFIMNKHIQMPLHVLSKSVPNTNFSETINTLYSFKNSSRKSLLHQLRWNEFYAHLQRILVKVDRASMKHSLEVRVPFLDRESIEHSWYLEGELKCKKDLKHELKKLLSHEVPINLINQKKMGFSVPLYNWLHNELKADVMLHIFDKPFYGEEVLDVKELKQYAKNFFEKKHNNVWGLWHIYAWQKWASIHLEQIKEG